MAARVQGSVGRDSTARGAFGAAGLLVVFALLVYANSFHGPFVFDDIGSIVENPTIRQLWPLSDALSPPKDWGFTVSGRPILNLSLALNYRFGGLEVRGYHAVNLLIHILAGLALFGVIRRTLLQPRLSARANASATSLAFLIALLWLLHPLQTESVTYIVQRAESLMGLFFLGALYAFVRSVDSPRAFSWKLISACSGFLAAGTKEVAALIPLIVLLYDRAFLSGTFRLAWQRHRGRHLALLFLTWLPLAWSVATTGGNRGGTIGFGLGGSGFDHWLTQGQAITRYLQLAVWPYPLVFEYGKIAPESVVRVIGWWILPAAAFILVGVAWRRWPMAGFLGATFFCLLAPTSLVPGANQAIAEHRLYLPLAAVIALLVLGAAKWLGEKQLLLVGGVLALLESGATFQRNLDYQSSQALWEDTVAKRPTSARAQNNLGFVYYEKGRLADAIVHFREALRLDPTSAQAHYNLGLALMATGELPEAVTEFGSAVRILPYYFNAHLNRGIVLTKLGRGEEALKSFAEAARFDPSPSEVHFRWGIALAGLGRWNDAMAHYAEALKINPRYAQAQSNWGVALFQLQDPAAALEHFSEALRLNPELADVHFNLALVLTSLGRQEEAISHYTAAVQLNPRYVEAELNLGIALGQAGRIAEAIGHLERAVLLQPDSFAAHSNLAVALDAAPGRSGEALAHYEAALKLRPEDPQAHYNLGYALLALRRWPEARMHFERALSLRPNFSPAIEILREMEQRGL